jgi:hypothetical protein
VLARVGDQVFCLALHGRRDRRKFHKLGTCANDAENSHGFQFRRNLSDAAVAVMPGRDWNDGQTRTAAGGRVRVRTDSNDWPHRSRGVSASLVRFRQRTGPGGFYPRSAPKG